MTLLRNVSSEFGCYARGWNQLYIGLTLFSTVGLRHTVHQDEFHITTFFRVRFAGDVLLSTLVELLFCYSNKVLRIIDAFTEDHLQRIYLNCRGKCLSTGCRYIAFLMLKTGSVLLFWYGGNIPFVVSLCFASQRIPTACPCCAGSISTIGLAPFCFKSAGLALVWASAVLLWFLA